MLSPWCCPAITTPGDGTARFHAGVAGIAARRSVRQQRLRLPRHGHPRHAHPTVLGGAAGAGFSPTREALQCCDANDGPGRSGEPRPRARGAHGRNPPRDNPARAAPHTPRRGNAAAENILRTIGDRSPNGSGRSSGRGSGRGSATRGNSSGSRQAVEADLLRSIHGMSIGGSSRAPGGARLGSGASRRAAGIGQTRDPGSACRAAVFGHPTHGVSSSDFS